MKRLAFNFLTTASLLLCVAILTLAARSCWRADNWVHTSDITPPTLDDIACLRGRVEISRIYSNKEGMLPPAPLGWSHHSYPALSHGSFGREWRGRWGVYWQPLSLIPFGLGMKYRAYNIPLWPIAAIFAVLPIV